ncbi:hypothetical protein [Rhizobium sp. BK251]|uniref:hypothetical protein n=1 Tax=Rhizobium sp. BK251 TaxID=2512125 RepID=UPI0010EA91C1|nr:hypothetical protein [Rhizobium sp. BK251]TCL63678.1 hypothetical protein EV286_11676 [Rhizobium sp. BK251]
MAALSSSINAAKYRVLSINGGQVFLRWSVSINNDPDKPMLKLRWEKRGGLPVTVH